MLCRGLTAARKPGNNHCPRHPSRPGHARLLNGPPRRAACCICVVCVCPCVGVRPTRHSHLVRPQLKTSEAPPNHALQLESCIRRARARAPNTWNASRSDSIHVRRPQQSESCIPCAAPTAARTATTPRLGRTAHSAARPGLNVPGAAHGAVEHPRAPFSTFDLWIHRTLLLNARLGTCQLSVTEIGERPAGLRMLQTLQLGAAARCHAWSWHRYHARSGAPRSWAVRAPHRLFSSQ